MPDLMPLTKPKFISRFMTFDIEARDWSKFALCGIYDGEKYQRFESLAGSFDALVCKGTRNVPMFAHNLSYDGMFILDHILTQRPDLKAVPVLSGSRMISISVSDSSRNLWKFRDSFSILPTSLRNLTYSFDVKHKKLDEHEEKGMIGNEEYNKNDCIGLYEVLQKFFGILDGKVGMTISQTSLLNFREKFQKSALRSTGKFEGMIRSAYYGGRTEIFSFNMDPEKVFSYFDVNSLYPYCLAHYEFPFGKFRAVYPDIDEFGFSYATIDDDMYFPLLPERIDQKMMFRRGIKTGWYSNQELQRAEALGCRVEAYKTIATQEHGKIFKDFVESWYGKRMMAKQSGNEALQLVCKLVMNSLYGKFAQARERMMTIINPEEIHDGMNAVKIGRHVLYQVKDRSKANHIIPSISAMTTAWARIVMHRNFMKADRHLFYSDTDSCILDRPLFEHSKEIGKMKLEEEIHDLVIVLPKVYFYKDKDDAEHVKIKGIPLDNKAGLDGQKRVLRAFLAHEPVRSDKGLFPLRRAIVNARSNNISGLLFNKGISRTLRTYYDKRKIEDDFSCSPFRVIDDRATNEKRFEKVVEYALNSLG